MAKELKPAKRVSLPRYQQIAVDIAERIVEGRYKVGEKNFCTFDFSKQF